MCSLKYFLVTINFYVFLLIKINLSFHSLISLRKIVYNIFPDRYCEIKGHGFIYLINLSFGETYNMCVMCTSLMCIICVSLMYNNNFQLC